MYHHLEKEPPRVTLPAGGSSTAAVAHLRLLTNKTISSS